MTIFSAVFTAILTDESIYVRRVVSFNADLYPALCNPFDTHVSRCEPYEARSKNIANAIASRLTNADVICLQGVFFDEDEIEILHKTKELFPYSYSFTHEDTGEFKEEQPPPCTRKDVPLLKQVFECSDHTCHSKIDYDEFIACMEEQCNGRGHEKPIKQVFVDLSDSCAGCIFSGTKRDVYDCLKVEYAYNPTGVVLLSKRQIHSYKSEYFPHRSEIVRHGYLDVNIDNVGRVICTAMQPYIGKDYIDVSEGASSYEEKNFQEAITLAKITESSNAAVIAGCLNTSPSLTKGAIEPQFSHSLDVLRQAGFVDPISASYYGSFPSCTFCFANSYVKEIYKSEGYDGFIMDHVLVKGYHVLNSGTSQEMGQNKYVYRVLMYDDRHVPFSAHYGVSVDFSVVP